MARPRTRNLEMGLPSGVQFRHGAYYHVVRGRWIRLDDKPEQTPPNVLESPKALPALRVIRHLPADQAEILKYTTKVFFSARQNAKGRRRIAFELEIADVFWMLKHAGWRCAVTDIPFSFGIVNGKRPFAPSIDRVDSSRGYVRGNCRVVCVAANYAMNVWGEEVLRQMLRALGRKGRREASTILSTVVN